MQSYKAKEHKKKEMGKIKAEMSEINEIGNKENQKVEFLWSDKIAQCLVRFIKKVRYKAPKKNLY